MDGDALLRAAQEMLGAAMSDGAWMPALENLMNRMGVLGGGVARTTPPRMFAIPSSGVRQQFLDFQSGRTPPLTRRSHIRTDPAAGFITEGMAFGPEGRRRDPFYNEFLVPRHCVHQASAFLDRTDEGDLNLITYRSGREGDYETDELTAFGTMLPYLRAAVMASRSLMRAGARRVAAPFERRGEPVIHLGHDARVLDLNPAARDVLGLEIQVVAGRLVAPFAPDQSRLDGALRSTLHDGRPTMTTLMGSERASTVRLLLMPVVGAALDLFDLTAAVAILIDSSRPPPVDEEALSLMIQAGGLAPREAAVVRVIASGGTPRDAAARLNLTFDTARVYLKTAYQKLGVHGQVDLALLARRVSAS